MARIRSPICRRCFGGAAHYLADQDQWLCDHCATWKKQFDKAEEYEEERIQREARDG